MVFNIVTQYPFTPRLGSYAHPYNSYGVDYTGPVALMAHHLAAASYHTLTWAMAPYVLFYGVKFIDAIHPALFLGSPL